MNSGNLKAQLESVWRQTGVKPKELDEIIELPESCREVWYWFCELDNDRTSNGFGVNPIGYEKIKAYFDLYNITPQEWEVRLLKLLDNVALKHYSEESKKQSKNKSSKKQYRDWETDRKSTRLNSSHSAKSRMPSSA